MHHAFAPRFAVRFRVALLLAACIGLPAAARADVVYTVSMTNGGLFRFDSADPYGTMTALVSGSDKFFQPSALALGPDGNLYVGDLGSGGRISRYNLTTGSVSTVVLVNSGTDGYSGPVYPASIAFRPAALGGQMLVGRSPLGQAYYSYPLGPVLQIAGWQGNSPVVSDYTTGTVQTNAPGLAVAPDGTVYASNSLYTFPDMVGNVLSFGTSGAFSGEVVPDGSPGGLSGPAGLLLSGSTLYTASVMNSSIFATNLTTGSTTQFGPSIVGYFEVGPLASLASGDLLTGGVGGSGNIYRVWDSGSSTLYDSTVAMGAPYNLGETFNLGQIGGLVTMVVPEPGTLALAAGGLAAAGAWFRRRAVA